MQEIWAATSQPVSRWVAMQVSSVPDCVLPPAPKVTEKKAGCNAASCLRTSASRVAPFSPLGGKNSKLN